MFESDVKMSKSAVAFVLFLEFFLFYFLFGKNIATILVILDIVLSSILVKKGRIKII